MGKSAGFGKYLTNDITDDRDLLRLIEATRRGLDYATFKSIADKGSFTLSEWCTYLHISMRTMQRLKKEKRAFDPVQSERILQIALLTQRGSDVFGSADLFHTWLGSNNLALGGVLPKELLDSTFGIDLIRDTLTRIEHGVLA